MVFWGTGIWLHQRISSPVMLCGVTGALLGLLSISEQRWLRVLSQTSGGDATVLLAGTLRTLGLVMQLDLW